MTPHPYSSGVIIQRTYEGPFNIEFGALSVIVLVLLVASLALLATLFLTKLGSRFFSSETDTVDEPSGGDVATDAGGGDVAEQPENQPGTSIMDVATDAGGGDVATDAGGGDVATDAGEGTNTPPRPPRVTSPASTDRDSAPAVQETHTVKYMVIQEGDESLDDAEVRCQQVSEVE